MYGTPIPNPVLPSMPAWRTEIGHAGFDLGDNLGNLVDLRFADDILLFANSGPEVAEILDKFVKAVGKVGLIDKRGATTQYACDKGKSYLESFGSESREKWLGCILTACGSKMQDMDVAYHMEQGTKAMHVNRWILQDKTTSIYTRLSE